MAIKYRQITAKQLGQGFFRLDLITHMMTRCAYVVIQKNPDGTFMVVEPENYDEFAEE